MSGMQIFTEDNFINKSLPDGIELEGEALLALEYFKNGLSMAVKRKNHEMQSYYYNCIGVIFLRFNDEKNALKYFEKAYKTLLGAKKEENISDQILFHLRKASVYAKQGKHKELESEYKLISDFMINHPMKQMDFIMKYFEIALSDFRKDKQKIHEICQIILTEKESEISIQKWDIYIEILKIIMKYDYTEDIDGIHKILDEFVKTNQQYQEKRLILLRLWIDYLNQTEQKEARRSNLRTYYEIEHQTKEKRKRNQIQQINNRLLLDQKLEERSMMKQKRKSLNENVKKDALTKLYSRYAMMEYIEEILELGAKEQKPIKGVSIEIEDFKSINEKYGYVIGDMSLKYLAEAIQRNNTKNMMAAHMRGNEMMIFTYEYPKESIETFMEGIELSLRKPLFFNDNKLQIKINYGIVEMIPTKDMTVFEVFQQANKVLMSEKIMK